MLLEFDIMFSDTKIAAVEYGDSYVKIVQFYNDFMFRLFRKEEEESVDALLKWMNTRCFPTQRHSLKGLLKDLGLVEYDTLSILKLTHGLVEGDEYWIRFSGERYTYKEVINIEESKYGVSRQNSNRRLLV